MEWDETTIAEEPPKSVMTQFNDEVRKFWKKRSNSCIAWSAHIMLDLANIIMVVWMTAPGWSWTKEIGGRDELEGEYYGYYGLWYACWELIEGGNRQSCDLTSRMDSSSVPGYWKASQGLSICVIVLGISGFAVWTVYMFNRACTKQNTRIVLVYIALSLGAATLNVALVVTFAVEFYHSSRWVCCEPDDHREVLEWHLWYAFALSCVGFSLYIASGIAAIFEYVDIIKEQRLRVIYQEMEARRKDYPHSFEDPNLDKLKTQFSTSGYK